MSYCEQWWICTIHPIRNFTISLAPTAIMSELLRGLPRRVENYVRTQIRFRHIVVVVLLLFAGHIFGGIVEGETFDFWKESVRPFLATTYPDWPVSHRLLAVTALGWLLALA